MKKWTILNVLNLSADFLKSKGIYKPRLDVEILLSYILNIDRLGLYINYDKPLNEVELKEYNNFVNRRAKKEPISYIIGYKEFWSINIKVDKRVLIPRPESELLVEEALKIAYSELETNPNRAQVNMVRDCWSEDCMNFNILDIGTGSGAISLSLAKEIKNSKVFAVDISKEAIEIASENARMNSLSSKIVFKVGDLFSSFYMRKFFDIIVSNPPYISEEEWHNLPEDIRDYEPKIALYGGKDGLYFLKRIINEAPLYLKDNGWLILEIGYNQGDMVKNIFNENDCFYTPEIIKDYGGYNRIIRAQKRWIN